MLPQDQSDIEVVDLQSLPKPLRAAARRFGKVHPAPPIRPRWTDAARVFLDSNVTFRKAVILVSTVIAPAVLAALSFSDKLRLNKDQTVATVLTISVGAIILGALLVITERSSGEIAAALGDAEVALSEAGEETRRAHENATNMLKRHSDELARLAGLETLRQRLSFLVRTALVAQHKGNHVTVPNTTFLLLNEMAQVGHAVCGWTAAEKWSLAVYLWDESEGHLACSADIRPTSSDNGEGHRTWKVGRGMVGMTFFASKQLIVADATSSELEGVMCDPDPDRAESDRHAYKSVAAVPIFNPDAYVMDGDTAVAQPSGSDPAIPPLFGVVVATSDVAERFSSTPRGDLPLIALTAVADALAMVLIASEFRRALTTDSSEDGSREKDESK